MPAPRSWILFLDPRAERANLNCSRVAPTQELTEVVAVAAHGGGREIIALQLAQKTGEELLPKVVDRDARMKEAAYPSA